MSILDDAIREHLELKRAHGADEGELQRLEDEAFGPPQRPDEIDPFAEAPTEFLLSPEETAAAVPEVGDEAARSGRRPNITDLQEGPPTEVPVPPEAPPADEAPAPADAPPAPEVEERGPEVEGRAPEEVEQPPLETRGPDAEVAGHPPPAPRDELAAAPDDAPPPSPAAAPDAPPPPPAGAVPADLAPPTGETPAEAPVDGARADAAPAAGALFDFEATTEDDSADAPPPADPAPPTDVAPPTDEAPIEEEHPAGEHEIVAAPDPDPDAAERHAIADQPTQMFDVQAEMDAEPAAAAPPEQPPLETRGPDAEVAGHPPPEAAPEEESSEFDFFNEQRLSDELDQALEAPLPPTDEHIAMPRYEDAPGQGGIFDFESEGEAYEERPAEEAPRPAPEPPSEEAERDSFEPPSEEAPRAAAEPPSEEAEYDYDPETGHEDVLEDTPRFLEDQPEDDDLWFEQKPPKDFDLD
ncbi:MAG: hypothetical protein JSU06_02185 [Actinobacteria bacterium]|nr:hypothetical protein [Actinomycetota bacterium]